MQTLEVDGKVTCSESELFGEEDHGTCRCINVM